MPNIVKNTALINPLDLLAPHTCRGCGRVGTVFCECCKKDIISSHQNFCPICQTKNRDGICQKCHNLPPIFIIDKRSGIIGSLIHDFKYNSVRALKNPLAEILHQTLPAINGEVVVVPLPTNSNHIRSRGFDHTYSITKKFTKLRGTKYQTQKLLIRNKNTVQVGTNRSTRFIQAKDAYGINRGISVDPNATYLLFDDIWTTGSSMFAAIKKLREAGVNNLVVAILAISTLDDK